MTAQDLQLGVLTDILGDFGATAKRVLRKYGIEIKTSSDSPRDLKGVDVVVVGTAGRVTLAEVKRTAQRIREVHGTLPTTPVVFAATYVTSVVVQTAISAGAISCVTFEALPRTIGNLASCSRISFTGFREVESSVVERAHDPESGRLDGKRIADLFGIPLSTVARAVGVTPSALSRRPTATSAQDGLRELTFVWRSLMNVFRVAAKAKAWLHAPRVDLGGEPALALLTKGRAKDLGDYIRRAFAGEAA